MKKDEVINDIKENMEEGEFLGIIGKNALFALGITVGALVVSYLISAYILPMFISGADSLSPASFVSIFATTFVVAYVYRKKIVVRGTTWHTEGIHKVATIWNILKYFVFAILYSTAMYIGGEIIVITLLGLGIAVTVMLLASESGFTTWLTWRDLKKWVAWRKAVIKENEPKENTPYPPLEDDGEFVGGEGSS